MLSNEKLKIGCDHATSLINLEYFSILAPIFLGYLILLLSCSISVVCIILFLSSSYIPLIWAVIELCGLYFDFYLFFYLSLSFSFYLSFYLYYLTYLNYLTNLFLPFFYFNIYFNYFEFFSTLADSIFFVFICFLLFSSWAMPQEPNMNLLIVLWLGIFRLNN